jgi:hypothetical protein
MDGVEKDESTEKCARREGAEAWTRLGHPPARIGIRVSTATIDTEHRNFTFLCSIYYMYIPFSPEDFLKLQYCCLSRHTVSGPSCCLPSLAETQSFLVHSAISGLSPYQHVIPSTVSYFFIFLQRCIRGQLFFAVPCSFHHSLPTVTRTNASPFNVPHGDNAVSTATYFNTSNLG